MVWTKLAYLRFPECFKPQLINGKWRGAEVGSRYRSLLRKEFIKAGVPWEFEAAKTTQRHPFDRAPKHSLLLREKAARVKKITKALENQDALISKYRQDFLNSRRLAGADYLVRTALGSYIKGGKHKGDS
jgi:hypothetical protein